MFSTPATEPQGEIMVSPRDLSEGDRVKTIGRYTGVVTSINYDNHPNTVFVRLDQNRRGSHSHIVAFHGWQLTKVGVG